MANIFSRSFLTLCNLQGNSCLGRFLRAKLCRPKLQIPFRSKLDTSVSGIIHLRVEGPAELIEKQIGFPVYSSGETLSDMSNSPWNSRIWTFQEALLSPRAIFFGNRMFSYAWGDQHIFADGSRFPRKCFLSSSKLTPDDPMRGWYESMQDYSRRRLTYETDKLPAISALAKLLSDEHPGQEYLAGLWKSDLHRGLIWFPFLNRNREDVLESCSQGYKLKHASQEYIALSWSWARYPDAVHWIAEITSSVDGRVFLPKYTSLNVEVVAAVKSNQYGRVSSACLKLDAELFQVPLRDDGTANIAIGQAKYNTLAPHLDYILSSPGTGYIAHFQPDWDYPVPNTSDSPNGPMWMVLTSSIEVKMERNPGEKCLGLLLLPTGNEREFIRVGVWFHCPGGHRGKRQWEGIQPQSIGLFRSKIRQEQKGEYLSPKTMPKSK